MKIPIEIQKTDDDSATQFRVFASLQDAIAFPSIDKEFIKIQAEYGNVIKECQKILRDIEKSKNNRGNPILRWNLANNIYKFAKELEGRGFVFANLTEALSRDLKIAGSGINYLIKFRTIYPNLELVSKNIIWNNYRELLDISDPSFRKECENKILKGELKTQDEIRAFKKQRR